MARSSTSGQGRPVGAINNATKNAREAIGMLVEGNIPRMQGWLDEIAKTDGPAAAWRCLQDVIEYHIPKLARTELTGPGGGAVVIEEVLRKVVDPKA